MKNKILKVIRTLNISLLLVEDEDDARLNISNMIRRRVAKLYIAKSASEALEIYEKQKPDLLLSDIQMPGMDGLEMAEIIREKNPKAKIIIMTAHTDTNYLMKAIELQIDGYIVKPINKMDLVSAIEKQKKYILAEKKIQEQEIAIAKSEEKYRIFFEYNDAIILFIDPMQGEILFANNAAISFYGYPKDQLVGQNISLINKLSPKEIKEKMAEALSRKQNFFVFEHRLANGEIREVEIYQTMLHIDGKEVFSVIVHDISDRKKVERELSRYTADLHERNQELEEFSHTVAHDLKNPLANIIGFSSVLTDGFPDIKVDDAKRYIAAISKSADKMQQIIQSLLLLASVRKTDAPINEIYMGGIVEESIARLSMPIENGKVKVKRPKNWPTVLGYAPWVEEVWVNYLSNAIKYGGVPARIELGFYIERTEDNDDQMIRFWIRDNGKGISKENQKLLFEKFERLEQIKTEGHGLGLSIVQRIVEKLGGQVGLESNINDGKGSLFYFTLPFNKNAEYVLPFEKEQTPIAEELVEKLKILIVEDEDFVDYHLTTILQSRSREILHAKTGAQALELYYENKDIDLILMDIRLPIMNGYDVTSKIRESDKDIIIISQTAYALEGDRDKSLNAGCNNYITKPIDKDKLFKMIGEHFNNSI